MDWFSPTTPTQYPEPSHFGVASNKLNQHFKKMGFVVNKICSNKFGKPYSQQNPSISIEGFNLFGGERGIRTLDTVIPYTDFPGLLIRPL